MAFFDFCQRMDAKVFPALAAAVMLLVVVVLAEVDDNVVEDPAQGKFRFKIHYFN